MANSEIITKLKQIVIRDILDNPEIVFAIDSPWKADELWDKSYLVDSFMTEDALDSEGYPIQPHIFTYHKDPFTIEKNITLINILVNTYGNQSSNFVSAELHFYIYSHKEHMKVSASNISDNRNDYLSKLIDAQFNNRELLYDDKNAYIGKFILTKNMEGVYNNTFLYRHLVFICNDINASIC